MAVCVIIGIFIARVRNVVVGGTIVVAAGIFLLHSGAKTSIGLLPLTLALGAIVLWLRSTALRLLVVVGGVLLFNIVTLGSVFLDPVHGLLEAVMSDPSFTNRDDVWRFAAEHALDRPLTGYGFEAFWRTSAVVYGGSSIETWAARTSDAHNSYLNVAITMGLPALALVVVWLHVQTILDIGRSERIGNDRALAALFVQIWMFGIFTGCLESTFFINGGPVWLTVLMAVFGLRHHATARVVP